MVKVFAELAARHRLLEVAIRRSDHPRVALEKLVASHAREPEVLQHVEELGLEGQRQLRQLVQVDRAPVRVLELPVLAPVRAGKGAPLVPEELGLEQTQRDRGAVDLDERTTIERTPGYLSARGGTRHARRKRVARPCRVVFKASRSWRTPFRATSMGPAPK
jgi:hypothetical protein